MNTLSDLLDIHAMQQMASNVFPTLESLRWYLRTNRDGLTSAGALLQIGGKTWIKPVAFEEFVFTKGREPRRQRITNNTEPARNAKAAKATGSAP